MMHAILWIAGGYALLVATWTLYLAVMNLKEHLPLMGPVAKMHGYALLVVGLVFDAFVNFVIGTALFADPPREWLLTARLKRYHGVAYIGTRRARIAEWICTHLLDVFDPNGDHC